MGRKSTKRTFFGCWKAESIIGAGSYGIVYRIRKDGADGSIAYDAMKHVSLPQHERELDQLRSEGLDAEAIASYYQGMMHDVMQEIELMSRLAEHPNIVRYEEHEICPKPNGVGFDIYIRMELLEGLPAYLRRKGISRADVVRLGLDLASALEVCAGQQILHRDIKYSNIFVDGEGRFKLGDFGIARQLQRTQATLTRKGTFRYMAPEVFRGEEYDSRADLYSLGLVMYRMINDGYLPFSSPGERAADAEKAVFRRLRGEPLPPPKHTDALSGVIARACAYRPDERYRSAAEMHAALDAIGMTEADAETLYLPANVLTSETPPARTAGTPVRRTAVAAVCAALAAMLLFGGLWLSRTRRQEAAAGQITAEPSPSASEPTPTVSPTPTKKPTHTPSPRPTPSPVPTVEPSAPPTLLEQCVADVGLPEGEILSSSGLGLILDEAVFSATGGTTNIPLSGLCVTGSFHFSRVLTHEEERTFASRADIAGQSDAFKTIECSLTDASSGTFSVDIYDDLPAGEHVLSLQLLVKNEWLDIPIRFRILKPLSELLGANSLSAELLEFHYGPYHEYREQVYAWGGYAPQTETIICGRYAYSRALMDFEEGPWAFSFELYRWRPDGDSGYYSIVQNVQSTGNEEGNFALYPSAALEDGAYYALLYSHVGKQNVMVFVYFFVQNGEATVFDSECGDVVPKKPKATPTPSPEPGATPVVPMIEPGYGIEGTGVTVSYGNARLRLMTTAALYDADTGELDVALLVRNEGVEDIGGFTAKVGIGKSAAAGVVQTADVTAPPVLVGQTVRFTHTFMLEPEDASGRQYTYLQVTASDFILEDRTEAGPSSLLRGICRDSRMYAMPEEDFVITWTDKVFENCIRDALDKPTGNIWYSETRDIESLYIWGGEYGMLDPPTPSVVDGVNYINDQPISLFAVICLDDIKYFPSLREFELMIPRGIRGTLDGLMYLTKLESFRFVLADVNERLSLQPLVAMTELSYVNLSPGFADITPLGLMPWLDTVYLAARPNEYAPSTLSWLRRAIPGVTLTTN